MRSLIRIFKLSTFILVIAIFSISAWAADSCTTTVDNNFAVNNSQNFTASSVGPDKKEYYLISVPSAGELTLTNLTPSNVTIYYSLTSCAQDSDSELADGESITFTEASSLYILALTGSANSNLGFTLTFTETKETTYTNGTLDFDLINPSDTRNIIGNTQIIGNTVQCVTSNFRVTSTDYTNLDCSNDLNKNDNGYIVRNINSDNDPATFNSSSATIKLPSTFKEIAWAGLYWQGHINNYSYQSSEYSNTYNSNPYNGWDLGYVYWALVNDYNNIYFNISEDYTNNDIQETTANTVLLQINSETYKPITADSINYLTRQIKGQYGITYSAFANVTSYFSSYTPGSNIDITIANVMTTEGLETYLGNYGAWTLVVVYKEDEENSLSKLRNNSVYLGYKSISDGNPDTITINDFLLPKSGDIDSQMAVFAAEGEYVYSPDTMELDGVALGDPDEDNVFDARLSDDIERNPSLTNNNGIDIDVFDTSAIMTAKRNDNLTASSYSSTISLTSSNDLYLPSMVSFTTELYKPRVCYYINTITDSSGTNIFEDKAFVDEINSGEEYTFNVWISNIKEPGSTSFVETANLVQVYLKMEDFNYVSGSTYIQNVGETTSPLISDAKDGDIGEHNTSSVTSTWRVGLNADSSQGGTLVPNELDPPKAFASFNGSITTDENTTSINLLDYLEFKASFQTDTITIGPDNAQIITQCEELNVSGLVGIAPAGLFNVIMSDQVSNMVVYGSDPMPDEESPLNAIPTQVSNKPFEIAVVALEKDGNGDPTVLSPFKGVVTVELIKQPEYTEGADNDLACASAPTISAAPTYFYFPVNGGGAIFSEGNYVYQKASRDAAFRVKYLTNGVNTEAIDWNCATNTYNCIWGMLTSTYGPTDTPCESVCKPGGGTGNNQASDECIECVFGGAYAGSVCSRDNFAIRPDKFAITLPALLRSARDYNASIIAQQHNSTLATLNYNVANAQAELLPLNENKTIYYLDGSVATNTQAGLNDLNGTLAFGSTAIEIIDGTSSTVGLSFDDVGLVNIKLVDANWSAVDISKGQTLADCSETGGYICGDVNATFIPDHFTLDTPTLHNAQNQTFTYFSNDLNHSAALNLTLVAKNADDDKTDNFTQNAWENPVNVTFVAPQLYGIDANKTEIDGGINLGFTSGQKVLAWSETNTSRQLNFNYQRATNTPLNPIEVNGTSITIDALSTYTSGGLTETVTGTAAADQNATFVYGRTHAPNQIFTGNAANVLIYYEAYCNGTDSAGNKCDRTLLPNGLTSTPSDDPRWFIIPTHTSASGTAGSINKRGLPVGDTTLISATAPTGNHPDSTNLTYQATKGYPYKATMENNASDWLIYNKYDAAAQKNEFEVEFTSTATDWSGKHESDTTSTGTPAPWTNRRVDW